MDGRVTEVLQYLIESSQLAPGSQDPLYYQKHAPRIDEGPIDLEHFLPGEGPIEIDVGFGRGMSLFERAQRVPSVRLFGIEIKSKWAYKVAQRADRLGLDRVRVLCGDARDILSRCTSADPISRVYIHFPDPWWKKRHAKRRVVGEALLDEAARLLAPGGELFIQTDVEDRADLYARVLREHRAFQLIDRPDSNPFGAISNRERRAEEDGLPVYRLLAKCQ